MSQVHIEKMIFAHQSDMLLPAVSLYCEGNSSSYHMKFCKKNDTERYLV